MSGEPGKVRIERRRLLVVVGGVALLGLLAALVLGPRRHGAEAAPAPSHEVSEPGIVRRPVTSRIALAPTPEPVPDEAEPEAAAEPAPEATPVAYVYGTVSAPDGAPVARAFVRFASLDLPVWTQKEFDCDEGGSYVGELPPGTWMASMNLGPSNQVPLEELALREVDPSLLSLPQPLPLVNTLAPNTSTEFSFRVGGGPGVIAGNVVDEHDRPFGGLLVYASIAELENVTTGETIELGLTPMRRQTTDPQGRFRLEGLHPGRYRISVEPEGFSPMAGPGQSKVGRLVERQEVRVAGEAPATLTLHALRPHPVRIEGRLTPRSSLWSATLVLPAGERRSRDSRRPVDVAPDGTFAFYLEGSEPDVVLELVSQGGQITTVPVVVTPEDTLNPLPPISIP